MQTRTTVWLVRHAMADGIDGRCCGRYDAPLSSIGIRQARELARHLEQESFSHVYSSNLSRAVETARIVAEPHKLPVRTMEDLAEIHFGDFEGLTYDEIEKRYPEVFSQWMKQPTEVRFPNGESFSQMQKRVLHTFELLLSRHRNESVVIVSHAGVIRIALGKAMSIPDDQVFRLAQRHGAINLIHYDASGPMVELMNHYPG